jgi:RHH-type proline utilization regulon transcriptional repressor/proline dehydrogenase/delta 1-pyrroline-5-carboxylate dehydrogenase
VTNHSLVSVTDEKHAQAAIDLAAKLYGDARVHRTRHEIALDTERSRMVEDLAGKTTLTNLMDQAFRSKDPATTAEQMTRILKEGAPPQFFSFWERVGLWLFGLFAMWLPRLFVPIVKYVIRRKTQEVILPGGMDRLVKHVLNRKRNGTGVNFNHLGEMILGEFEADLKTQNDVRLLLTPEVTCISVKASNLYSQVSALAHEQSVSMMIDRLRTRLYAALVGTPHKLVNLDMEAYSDMAITIDAFKRILEEPDFRSLQVGLAIQAYLPDSYGAVVDLLAWARERVAAGGTPIRIRVVKGANRSMELVESSLQGIECPVYDDKVDTDANWKSIVELISRPENIAACHLGIATHNVFDLCWAVLLVQERGIEQLCKYEMLEGMVNHAHREVQQAFGNVLLYAPVVTPDKFLTAIAYLMRRFDELTDPVNFLSHIFGITPEAPEWADLTKIFRASLERAATVSHARRRTQDRNVHVRPDDATQRVEPFENERDTDWSSAANREWLGQKVIRHIRSERLSAPWVVALASTACVRPHGDRPTQRVTDRSYPGTVIAEVQLAQPVDVDDILNEAVKASLVWQHYGSELRERLLLAAADQLRQHRAELIATAAMDVGKTFGQSDGEVSEAIDFGVLYPLAYRRFREAMPHVGFGPLGKNGVIVVVSPWNFPIAIPAGGVFAALAAGNAVILKPSSESRLITTRMAECLWQAGVPLGVLQVVNCGHDVANALVSDPRVDAVILTGGTDTADRIIAARPQRPLFAETGGKNATIVTGNADREMAIKHVVDSFRHNGQKCSATSLLLLTPELYEDRQFLAQLRDAVASLHAGPADDPASVITPLFRTPGADLHRGFTTLDEGESWLVEPNRIDGRDDFWTPGVKMGVRRGSFMHLTELFGPVLGVMRVADLDNALALIKDTGYGLTLGVESLDDREIRYIVDRGQAGVIYCNRSTVGAIVQRQTFGGWKDSRRGPGIHAGGLNYVTNFFTAYESSRLDPLAAARRVSYLELARVLGAERAQAVDRLQKAVAILAVSDVHPDFALAAEAMASQLEQWVDHFSKDQRPGRKIRGEDNVHRYRPLGRVIVRITLRDTTFDIITRLAAAIIAGNEVFVSVETGATLADELRRVLPEIDDLGFASWREESDTVFSWKLGDALEHACVRYARPEAVSEQAWQAVARNGRAFISAKPVLRTARLELLRYLQEQTVAAVYHRYGGNLRDEDKGT